jgi:hypothetical protein
MPKASFGNRLILKGLDCEAGDGQVLLLKKIAVDSSGVVEGRGYQNNPIESPTSTVQYV